MIRPIMRISNNGLLLTKDRYSAKSYLKKRRIKPINLFPFVSFSLVVLYMVLTMSFISYRVIKGLKTYRALVVDLLGPLHPIPDHVKILDVYVSKDNRYWWRYDKDTSNSIPELIPLSKYSTYEQKTKRPEYQLNQIFQHAVDKYHDVLVKIIIHPDAKTTHLVGIIDGVYLVQRRIFPQSESKMPPRYYRYYMKTDNGVKSNIRSPYKGKDLPSIYYLFQDWTIHDDLLIEKAVCYSEERRE